MMNYLTETHWKHKTQSHRTTRVSTKINRPTHHSTTKTDENVLIYDQTISMMASPLQWVWQSSRTSPSPATQLWCLKAVLCARRATCVGLNVPQTHALTSAFPPHTSTNRHTHTHTHTPPRQPALCSMEGWRAEHWDDVTGEMVTLLCAGLHSAGVKTRRAWLLAACQY